MLVTKHSQPGCHRYLDVKLCDDLGRRFHVEESQPSLYVRYQAHLSWSKSTMATYRREKLFSQEEH